MEAICLKMLDARNKMSHTCDARSAMGLYYTYALYVFLPKDMWPIIKLAESDTPDAVELRNKLVDLMNARTQNRSVVDLGVEDFETSMG